MRLWASGSVHERVPRRSSSADRGPPTEGHTPAQGNARVSACTYSPTPHIMLGGGGGVSARGGTATKLIVFRVNVHAKGRARRPFPDLRGTGGAGHGCVERHACALRAARMMLRDENACTSHHTRNRHRRRRVCASLRWPRLLSLSALHPIPFVPLTLRNQRSVPCSEQTVAIL
jgi:hypothetical protein